MIYVRLVISTSLFLFIEYSKLALCQLVWVKKFYTCNREGLSCSLSSLIPFIFLFKGVLMDNQNSSFEMIETTVSKGHAFNHFNLVINPFKHSIGIRCFNRIFDIILVVS